MQKDLLERHIGWFLDDLRVTRGSSPNTVSNYRRDLERYCSYVESQGIQGWESVDRATVERYLLVLAEGDEHHQGLAPSSRARSLSAVRSFHRWLAQNQLAPSDVAAGVKAPKRQENLPKALSIGQVESLLEAAKVGDTPRSWRDSALLEFLYATGARVSEAVAVTVDDIDLDADFPVVRLFGKGKKERLVPLGSYAREAIATYLVRGRPSLAARGRGTPQLFVGMRGQPLSRQSAWEVMQSAASRAGLEASVSPHTLRHSFATHLLEGGASIREVQELLGHASVTTTQIYTRMTVQSLREVYRTSHPRAL